MATENTTNRNTTHQSCMMCLSGEATVGHYCAACIPAVIDIWAAAFAEVLAERKAAS